MPPSPYTPPRGYDRIRVVRSFEELATARFSDGVNALCWPRSLPGDFGEIVRALGPTEGIAALDKASLHSLPLSTAGRAAVEVMLEDLCRLTALGRAPELNCIAAYPRDEEAGAVPTDVYSWHADRAPVEADTWLCTYHGPATEGLRNEEALRRIDHPATRAALLAQFGGKDDHSFRGHLAEHCYDLHYAAAAGALPHSFGLGHLWRIAVEWPGSPVPPCVHRAPATQPGDPPRLLLIS